MNNSLRRVLSWVLVLCMVLSLVPTVHGSGLRWEKTDRKLTADLSDRPVRQTAAEDRDPGEMVRVSIVLEQPSAVEAGYSTMGIAADRKAMAYRAELKSQQKVLEKTISARVLKGEPLDVVWNMTLVGNIISAWVPYGSLEDIAAIPGIKTVAMEAQYEPAAAERSGAASPSTYLSSGMTGSGVLWSGGYTGAGSRIAIIDTGLDTDHQSFDNGAYLYALECNAAERGMSQEEYRASLDLMDEESIAAVLTQLHAYARYDGLTAGDLYLNEKLPFGFNYVDYSLNIVHELDQQGEHGSHVAGISAANRYIPQNGGYADARDSVMMLGVAPDAQLITMKVFGKGSPFDSDYMVAIEDAIMLGCDAVNLSLGTTVPGSPHTDVYSGLMEMMTHTDTVVTISAGNAYNWAAASTFGYLYHDDVSFNTVGSPGSYGSAFTVASVENSGAVGYYFTASGKSCLYTESGGYAIRDFASLDKNGSGTEYEYVFLDAPGSAGDYMGLDVARKIVFVADGGLSHSDKANYAVAKGAAAVVICGTGSDAPYTDLSDYYYTDPVAAIGYSDAQAIRAASAKTGDAAYTGTMTVYGRAGTGVRGGYTMSDFSSWGVPGSLTLKPEITAPGGNIYSVWGSNPVSGGGSDKYETMSGTSMAAPQVAGMAALLAQVIRERGLSERTGIRVRHLTQSLLMSTAQPLYEAAGGGGYYSLLNQGAGLARVDLASQAGSFVQVLGQDDYKVKAELGDDPDRTGIYTFDFTITNLEDTEQHYTLDADMFRQDVFEYVSGSDIWLLDTQTTGLDGSVTFYSDAIAAENAADYDLNGDGRTNAADADLLLEFAVGNEPELKGEGDISGDGKIDSYDAHLLLSSLGGDAVTVPAGGTVTVTVSMALSEDAMAELDAETPKGTFVEAFVYARGGEGTVHSIPVLAFYGDWSQPTMYDRGTLLDLVSMTSSTAPYLYQAIGPYGNALGIDYGDGSEYYYGGNPVLDDDTYIPERNAFNSKDASRLTEQGFTLIRGAGAARIQITNTDTGEVYLRRELGELYPAYYNPSYGVWENTIQNARLDWYGKDAEGKPLAEGTNVSVTLTAVPHYYRQEDGSYPYEGLGEGTTMTTTFTIDNTAPELLDIDLSRVDAESLTVTAKDNRHVAAVAVLNAAGNRRMVAKSPNQTESGETVTLELDLSRAYGSEFLVAVYDYANNMTAYRVEMELGTMEREYFTAIDYNNMTYVGVDREGQTSVITETGLPLLARAAEYVGGYIFVITTDNSLCVANDEDLSVTQRICQLDPDRERLITGVNDLAYNYADGRLYVQYYSEHNREARPFLAVIDMDDGGLEQICELPVDVNTMAIDTEGNFYSAGYDSSRLYTYRVTDGTVTGLTTVGYMGDFYSTHLSTMAWDHNEDRLYWAYPNVMLEIDPKTAEVTVIAEQEATLVGLYTRPEEDEGMFDPVDRVDRIELSHTDTRVVLNNGMNLEAAVWPWYAGDRGVIWTTSDESVATVDENGRVTARGLGRCVITAVSRLDPGISASCTVSTFEHEKTLRAIIWDEEGEVWLSEFQTSGIPDYTKLSGRGLGIDLAAATMGQDGNLYAASLYRDSMRSDLYRLDPETLAVTRIGSSADAYVDLAPAPGAPGNSLMAVYGGNVLHVDAETGDYYNWYYMFSNNLVALAYVGTQEYKMGSTWDTMVDWYFIIDRLGYVYLMGFLEQDGKYYYLEHDVLAPDGIYTKLDFEMDTAYFGSAYFDGEMLYYSAYKESKNNVTLMAIDVAGGSKSCYELGCFDDGVWPVAGLTELGEVENHIGIITDGWAAQTLSRPVPVEQQSQLMGVAGGYAPKSSGEAGGERVRVDVTLPDSGTNADLTVSFDTAMLELEEVSGNAAAFAWNGADGSVRLSLAEAGTISGSQTVACLTFRALESGGTTVSVVTDRLGSEACGLEERISLTLEVEKPHAHTAAGAVKENETAPDCTEDGSHDSVVYCADCGEELSRETVTVPALGHSWKGVECERCDATRENPFVDVPNDSFCIDPVLWAVEEGITTGTSATTFDPNGKCARAIVVTFLWRAAGSPEPTTTENPFTDVKESDFYYKAVLWAVEEGITTGTSATTFSPTELCNRATVVTFLYRAMGSPAVSSSENPFSDVKVDSWYGPAVLWAVEKGITNGMGDGTFGVGATCTRAQVVTFLYRTLVK